MEEIVHGLAPTLKWLIMKKDSELPWVTRVARWALLGFGVCYGTLMLAEKFIEVFS